MQEQGPQVPIWLKYKLPKKFFNSYTSILCQTKIDLNHLVMVIEERKPSDQPQNPKLPSFFPNVSLTKYLLLVNLSKLEFTEIECNGRKDEILLQGVGSYFMFYDQKQLLIFVKGLSYLKVLTLELSPDNKAIVSFNLKSRVFTGLYPVAGAAYFDKKIYSIAFELTGNSPSSSYKAKQYIYDTNTEQLTQEELGFHPSVRTNYSIVQYKDRMFLFGGVGLVNKKANPPTDVWALDLKSLEWKNLRALDSTFYKLGSGACLWKDNIYGLGNLDGAIQQQNQDLFVYHIENNTLQSIKTDQSCLPVLFDATYTLSCSQDRLCIFYGTGYLWYISLDGLAPALSTEMCKITPVDETVSQNSLFESKIFSDVTFIVEGREIPAHKAVLCAGCRFFKNMFLDETEESTEEKQVIEIPNMKANIFEALLYYIYNTEVRAIDDIVWELFEEADNYYLPGLKKTCEDFLISHITSKNVLQTIDFAEKHEADLLRNAALQHLLKNYDNVFKMEGSMQIKQSTLLEICRLKLSKG